MCGIVISEKYKEILENPYQKLDVTFDGELIDMVRDSYILKAFYEYNILENVNINSLLIRNNIASKVLAYRSIGFLIAFDFYTEKERNKFLDMYFKKIYL